MTYMFSVRSAPALRPTSSQALACTLHAPPPLHRPALSRPTPRQASHASLSTRQGASAFNQPLSFDTSEVTSMGAMFSVRSAPALRPISGQALPCTHLAPPPLHCPALSRPTPRPASHASLSTRQSATAFNQPLSLDTSKVTKMSGMFHVRSARALPPVPTRVFVCTLHAPPPPHTHPTPSPHAAHFVCPLFHSAGCVGVQPAAEF